MLFFSGSPDTTAQAKRLESVLRESGIAANAVGKSDSNHSRLNDDIGQPDDPITKSVFEFLDKYRDVK